MMDLFRFNAGRSAVHLHVLALPKTHLDAASDLEKR